MKLKRNHVEWPEERAPKADLEEQSYKISLGAGVEMSVASRTGHSTAKG